MGSVSTYLNFMGTTEEAFNFYAGVFGTEITSLMRLGDGPEMPGMPVLGDDEQRLIMNVQLPILGGHVLMGTDMVASLGHELHQGNNVSINLEPDTRAETERLFAALSDGSSDIMPLTDMFWGAYFGTCADRFGTRWMFNCYEPAP
jgi:PhnB protein